MSPSGPNQGQQLGQGELFYKGELLVIPLYTNRNTDKLNNGIAPPYISTQIHQTAVESLEFQYRRHASHFIIPHTEVTIAIYTEPPTSDDLAHTTKRRIPVASTKTIEGLPQLLSHQLTNVRICIH